MVWYFTPLILASASNKMASPTVTVIFNSMSVDTLDELVKGSDSKTFILVLGWILVYATSVM